MSKWIFNVGLIIAILFGGFLGYKIAFPQNNIEKEESSLIDNGNDPDILGVNPRDIAMGQKLSDKYASVIAKALGKFFIEKQKELNERTCVGIFTDLNKDGNYDGYFLDKYTIQNIAPNELIVRYNGCSFLWYKNKEIVLSITTQTLLNKDVQDVGVQYVPSYVYKFAIFGDEPDKIKVKLIKKEKGMLPIDKYILQ